MTRQAVLGVDSSTQSTKVMLVDIEHGAVLAMGRSPHSGENIQKPDDWWQALRMAIDQIDWDGVELVGISVAGQQHGLVTIGRMGSRSTCSTLEQRRSGGGCCPAERNADFASLVGSRLVAAFTIAKLAHLQRVDPDGLAETVASRVAARLVELQVDRSIWRAIVATLLEPGGGHRSPNASCQNFSRLRLEREI